jgi:hypothetical protein
LCSPELTSEIGVKIQTSFTQYKSLGLFTGSSAPKYLSACRVGTVAVWTKRTFQVSSNNLQVESPFGKNNASQAPVAKSSPAKKLWRHPCASLTIPKASSPYRTQAPHSTRSLPLTLSACKTYSQRERRSRCLPCGYRIHRVRLS